MKYSKSSLFSVYSDNIGDKNLIQWVLEDYYNKKLGYYVKEGDSIYLKNNNMYLQIIKGNSSPNNLGLEVSLGPEKNDNSKWIINKKEGSDQLFRRGIEVYLYHPKMNVYLYNTGKSFVLVGNQKIEIVGSEKKDLKSLWKFELVNLNNRKEEGLEKVDYENFNNDNRYFKKKEDEWKKMLMKQEEEIKGELKKFNSLKSREKDILNNIQNTNENIKKILSEKCPATRICLNPIDVSCIPPKKNKEQKKNKDGLYSIVYVKDSKIKTDPYYINSNIVDKCKTLKEFDIKQSPLVKNKKYVPKDGVKLKITDFKISEFPESKDLVLIDSIPNDKKITDFKIEDLPGFEKLELKSK